MLDFLTQTRQLVFEEYVRLYSQKLVDLTAELTDKHILGITQDEQYVEAINFKRSAELMLDTYQQKIACGRERNPKQDLTGYFSIAYDPVNPTDLYAIFNSEQATYLTVLLTHENVFEYVYFNNCDKPTNITEQDWQTREEVWNRILANDTIKTGIGWDLDNENGHRYNFELHSKLGQYDTVAETVEKRCARYATSAEIETYVNTYKENNAPNNLMKLVSEAFTAVECEPEWVTRVKTRTEEYVKEIEKQGT